MNLSLPFIQRPVMTTLLMVAILLTGFVSYHKLPISNLPNVNYPTITVSVSFPGMTPEMMAHAVALPLEKQFMAIPGIKLVSSNNTLGSSSIVLQFDISKNMIEAAQDVQSAIITATPALPPQLPYAPTYRKENPAELPILYLSLTSDTINLIDLYTYANNIIGQRISMLAGVSQVSVFGSPLAIRLQVDPEKMAANDISLTELALQVALANSNQPTGQLDGPVEAPNISVDGQLLTAASWDEFIPAYRNGTPMRLKDLGKSVESFQNDKINVQYVKEGKKEPAIILAIQKAPSANTVEISQAIHHLLGSIKQEIPQAVKIDTFYDQSVSIQAAISDMNQTLIAALILVVVVIALYLGKITDTIIPSIIIPITLIATFIVMDILNFTLDNLSLLALTLAVGFIIDDAIVVLENIVRQQEAGLDKRAASIEGAGQIGFTIVSMTLSLVAVFLPMLLMGGLIGRLFNEFAVTLTAVTVISGLIALTLTPMLCSLFLPSADAPKRRYKLFEWSHRFNNKLKDSYGNALKKVIDHTAAALIVAFLCLLFTILFFIYLPVDFLPDEDTGFFIAYTQGMEAGSSMRMLEYENQVIDVLNKNPHVESSVAISSYSEYRKGQNLILLKPANERPSLTKVLDELKEQFAQIPGIQVFMKKVPLIDLSTGGESRGDYQIAMQSIYAEKVYRFAERMIAKMSQDPHFEGVNTDLEIHSPQINVTILRDKASSLGVTAFDIENAFNFGYSYNYITRINTPIDLYNVIMELTKKQQYDTNTFNSLWLRSSLSNKLVPMSAVAEWEKVLGASSVNHINQFPSATVDFNLGAGVPLGDAMQRIDALQKELMEPGVIMQYIGAIDAFTESVKNSGFLLFIAIFSIYIILGMLYESFIHPLTVLTTLPPALVGGLATLWIFGMPLSLYSYLGLILLIGIVKKNGIMMVDFALENIRTKGMNPKEAIVDASLVRFRPIMMTTVAAIAGAVPIALGVGAGAAARQPLGLVIIGGLLFSQLVTLFITPILYLVFEKVNAKIPWRGPSQSS